MIVSNSTPLINFAAIRRLDILEHLFAAITIPHAVEQELLEKGQAYPSARELQRMTCLATVAIKDRSLLGSLGAGLSLGEAEAITLALECHARWLIMDELKGRDVAESCGLRIIGSIGCLIQAKKIGIIPAIQPFLEAMKHSARFWVNPKLYHRILRDNQEI